MSSFPLLFLFHFVKDTHTHALQRPMGNTCATERSLDVKPSRNVSTLSYIPPAAPRHEALTPSAEAHLLYIDTIGPLLPLDFVDEQGSPLVDITKSVDSVREWLADIDTDDQTDGSFSLSPDAKDHMGSEAWLPATSTYDADEERLQTRVVRAVGLVTPKLPQPHRRSFF